MHGCLMGSLFASAIGPTPINELSLLVEGGHRTKKKASPWVVLPFQCENTQLYSATNTHTTYTHSLLFCIVIDIIYKQCTFY